MNDIHKLPDALNQIAAAGAAITRRAGELGPRGGRKWTVAASTAALLWVALYFFARFALDRTGLSVAVRVLVAMAPLPAFAWFLWAFIGIMRNADELERRIQLEALAVAFPLTALLFMTLGLMQIAVPLPPDDWSYRHTWPLMFVFYLVGLTFARRRYA